MPTQPSFPINPTEYPWACPHPNCRNQYKFFDSYRKHWKDQHQTHDRQRVPEPIQLDPLALRRPIRPRPAALPQPPQPLQQQQEVQSDQQGEQTEEQTQQQAQQDHQQWHAQQTLADETLPQISQPSLHPLTAGTSLSDPNPLINEILNASHAQIRAWSDALERARQAGQNIPAAQTWPEIPLDPRLTGPDPHTEMPAEQHSPEPHTEMFEQEYLDISREEDEQDFQEGMPEPEPEPEPGFCTEMAAQNQPELDVYGTQQGNTHLYTDAATWMSDTPVLPEQAQVQLRWRSFLPVDEMRPEQGYVGVGFVGDADEEEDLSEPEYQHDEAADGGDVESVYPDIL